MKTPFLIALARGAAVALIALAPQIASADPGHGRGIGGGVGGGREMGGGGMGGGGGGVGGGFSGMGGFSGRSFGGQTSSFGGSGLSSRFGSHLGSLRNPSRRTHSTLGTTSFSRPTTFARVSSSHRTALRMSSGLHHRIIAMHSRNRTAATHSRTRTHLTLANRGAMPAGFNHGNASWKQNGGTPPGWSQGKKTGWGCTPGSNGCMPPGLAKKAGGNNGNGLQTTSSTRNRTPQLATRNTSLRTSTGNRSTPQLSARKPVMATRAPTDLTRTPTTSAQMPTPTDLTRTPTTSVRTPTAMTRTPTTSVQTPTPIARPAPTTTSRLSTTSISTTRKMRSSVTTVPRTPPAPQ